MLSANEPDLLVTYEWEAFYKVTKSHFIMPYICREAFIEWQINMEEKWQIGCFSIHINLPSPHNGRIAISPTIMLDRFINHT